MGEQEQYVELFKALADETRLRILNLLHERELCVCDVMKVLNSTQSKASRHLSALKRAGLAADRREAQWMHYSLTPRGREVFANGLLARLRDGERCQEDLRALEAWLIEKKREGFCPPKELDRS